MYLHGKECSIGLISSFRPISAWDSRCFRWRRQKAMSPSTKGTGSSRPPTALCKERLIAGRGCAQERRRTVTSLTINTVTACPRWRVLQAGCPVTVLPDCLHRHSGPRAEHSPRPVTCDGVCRQPPEQCLFSGAVPAVVAVPVARAVREVFRASRQISASRQVSVCRQREIRAAGNPRTFSCTGSSLPQGVRP